MEKNVGTVEQGIRLAVAGALLSAAGIKRGPWRWLALGAVPLFFSGATRYCALKDAVKRIGSRSEESTLETGKPVVDETSEESFPASDAPAWTATKTS